MAPTMDGMLGLGLGLELGLGLGLGLDAHHPTQIRVMTYNYQAETLAGLAPRLAPRRRGVFKYSTSNTSLRGTWN